MQLAKIRYGTWGETVGIVDGVTIKPLVMNDTFRTLSDLLESDNPADAARSLQTRERAALASVTLLAPIDRQEVWAAGVTYKRSKVARMEESQGTSRFYDLVYEAPRPELFFKASPHRVAGPGEPVRIRADAKWNVPEPELTLVLNSRLKLVGFTVGNDMSCATLRAKTRCIYRRRRCTTGAVRWALGSRWSRGCHRGRRSASDWR